jgi:hypothetical protein
MVIWVCDCSNDYVSKVVLSDSRESELENDFDGNVEDFLRVYEKTLGINVDCSSWMTANEELLDEIDF